jgi:hypothetical protein
MKLYSQQLEFKFLRTICSRAVDPSLIQKILAAITEDHIYYPPCKQAFRRIKTLLNHHHEIPRFSTLTIDPVIDEDNRKFLRESPKDKFHNLSQVEEGLTQLVKYWKARILYDVVKVDIYKLQEDKVDIDSLWAQNLDKLGAYKEGPCFILRPNNTEAAVEHINTHIAQAKGPPIFEFNHSLVTISEKTGEIHRLNTDTLRAHLESLSNWQRVINEGRANERLVEAELPTKVVKAYESWSEWNVPQVKRVVFCPSLSKEGKLISQPGYDADTGLFLVLGDLDFGPFEKITREQLRKAKKYLRKFFREFPLDKLSYSVALSMGMVMLNRHLIRKLPLFVGDASKGGQGKSTLGQVISLIITGQPATSLTAKTQPDALGQQILAALNSGRSLISFDNVMEDFSSSALCTALTEEVYSDRRMFSQELMDAKSWATFYVNGNNIVIKEDLATNRALRIKFNMKDEHPEDHDFKEKLIEDAALAKRDKLGRAFLIILFYWVQAGCPVPKFKILNRFPELNKWVRAPLVYAGYRDPGLSARKLQRADPIHQQIVRILGAWYDVFGNIAMTVLSVIEYLEDHPHRKGSKELKAALVEIASDGKGGISPRRLGKWLTKYKERIEGGFRVDKAGTLHRAMRWKVTSTKSKSPLYSQQTDLDKDGDRDGDALVLDKHI